MVVFTCGHCGESVNKPKVEKHYLTKCRGRTPNLSCMDCFKDFFGKDYEVHTKCISEEQRYSAKGFVPKVNKGEEKQNNWVEMVQSVLNEQTNASNNVIRIIEEISKHSNTPRKKPKFINFVYNVCSRRTILSDIEAAWDLISVKLSALRGPNPKADQRNEKTLEENVKQTTGEVTQQETDEGAKVCEAEAATNNSIALENVNEKNSGEDVSKTKNQWRSEKKRRKHEAKLQTGAIKPPAEQEVEVETEYVEQKLSKKLNIDEGDMEQTVKDMNQLKVNKVDVKTSAEANLSEAGTTTNNDLAFEKSDEKDFQLVTTKNKRKEEKKRRKYEAKLQTGAIKPPAEQEVEVENINKDTNNMSKLGNENEDVEQKLAKKLNIEDDDMEQTVEDMNQLTVNKHNPKADKQTGNKNEKNVNIETSEEAKASVAGTATNNGLAFEKSEEKNVQGAKTKKQRKEEKKRRKYEAELQSAAIQPPEQEYEAETITKNKTKSKLGNETENLEQKSAKKHKNIEECDMEPTFEATDQLRVNKKNKKRKYIKNGDTAPTEEMRETKEEINEEQSSKKKKTHEKEEVGNLHEQNVASDEPQKDKIAEFDWHGAILAVLRKKGNEIPFKRLQKKVLAEYAEATGNVTDDRIADKLCKKLKSAPNVKVDKNRVLLDE